MQRQVSSALEQVRGSAAEASRRGSGRENEEDDNVIEHLVVPLRPRTSVTWSPDTVDNEDAGKRSSKRCCIYHAPRVFGEWSDTEDSDSEGDFDPRSRRKVKKSSKKKHGDHDHDHCPDCGGCSHHGQDEGPSGSGTRQGDAAPAPVAETVLAPSGASGPAGGSPSAGGEGSTKPGGPNPGDASGRGN